MARIYLATSWKNDQQPQMIKELRTDGHRVYDFRHPNTQKEGFRWTDVGEAPPDDPVDLLHILEFHPRARDHYLLGFRNHEWCDTCLMVNPCGVSAALELGYCVGRGKRGIICLEGMRSPELMYLLTPTLLLTFDEARRLLRPISVG